MPDPALILRAFLVWLVIAAAEVGQGILRVRLLNRHVGDADLALLAGGE